MLLTVPVSLQSCISLGRTVVFLHANKLRLSRSCRLPEYSAILSFMTSCCRFRIEFNHILLKEIFRVVFAGGVAVFTIAVMPRMIWDTGMFLVAAVLAILAFHLSNQIYNVFAQLFTRMLYGTDNRSKGTDNPN